MDAKQSVDRFLGRVLGRGHYDRQVGGLLRRSEGAPILVWQMGKVGSTSIEEAVRDSDVSAPFLRAHLLNPEMIVRGETYRRARARGTREYLRSDAIREALLSSAQPWKIITVVREPMGRNLSAFFQNLDVYIGPSARQQIEANGGESDSMLRATFVNHFDHNRPSEWFDREIRDLLGTDVLAQGFDTTRGVQLYQAGIHELLVLRMEDLAASGEAALRDFLALPSLRVGRGNVGDAKWYSPYYRRLRRNPMLPPTLVTDVYSSRYAHTFYTDAERSQLALTWLNP